MSCERQAGMPDLKETYAARDTRAFGGKVAHDIIGNIFSDNYIQETDQGFDEAPDVSSDTASVYFSISKTFLCTETEADAILDYVYMGNSFFLAATTIDNALLDKLYCQTSDTAVAKKTGQIFHSGSSKLIDGLDAGEFRYYYQPFSRYFSLINDKHCRVIGYNDFGLANCIVFFWGKGKLFLHCDPRAFGNYFLLKSGNYIYFQKLLQLMQPEPEHIYWTSFYQQQHRRKKNDFSTFSEILRYPPLAAAFRIALALLALYILFALKRRTRIIPPVLKNENNSVAFTETIARLYLQQQDNKNIADKMISYFYDYLRTQYFLNISSGSDDFPLILSKKSDVPFDKAESLYRAMQAVAGASVVDDYQLLSLNKQIEEFFKLRK